MSSSLCFSSRPREISVKAMMRLAYNDRFFEKISIERAVHFLKSCRSPRTSQERMLLERYNTPEKITQLEERLKVVEVLLNNIISEINFIKHIKNSLF